MAYFTLMASVAEAEVEALRQDPSKLLRPSFVSGVSHFLSYCVRVEPLGQLLTEAIDGGDLLHQGFWHPLRSPMVHWAMKVQLLTARLERVCGEAYLFPQDDFGWLLSEMNRLLQLYRHAAAVGECVVTALDAVGDNRVNIPWR